MPVYFNDFYNLMTKDLYLVFYLFTIFFKYPSIVLDAKFMLYFKDRILQAIFKLI